MDRASVTPERNVCRLCTNSDEYYINIFNSNESCEIIVEEAIEDLLDLPVALGDGLPNAVCRLCLRKLIEFREFKQMCFKSATDLRAYASGIDLSSMKEEAKDPKGAVEEENILDNKSPLNQIRMTEVFIPMPDQLEMGIVVDEEVVNGGEPHSDHDESGEQDFAEGEYCERAHVYIESAPLELGIESSMKEETDSMEAMAGVKHERREDIDEEGFPVDTDSIMESDPLDVGQMIKESFNTVYNVICSNIFPNQIKEGKQLVKEMTGLMCERSENIDEKYFRANTASHMGEYPLEVRGMVPSLHQIGEHENYYNKIVGEDRNPILDGNGVPPCSSQPNPTIGALSQERLQKTASLFSPASLEEREKVHRSERQTYRSQKCTNTSPQFNNRSPNGHQLRHDLHGDCLEYALENSDSFKSSVSDKFQRAPAEHLKTQAKEKPFVCNTCGKGFIWKGHLERHLNIHAGIKPSQGDACGKRLANQSSLNTHSLVQSGLKPYRCQMCGKCFIHEKGLKGHVNSHMGLRPFQCEMCGMAFARQSTLSAHLAVHSSVKPFKCETCGKAFRRKGAVHNHMKVHTRGYH